MLALGVPVGSGGGRDARVVTARLGLRDGVLVQVALTARERRVALGSRGVARDGAVRVGVRAEGSALALAAGKVLVGRAELVMSALDSRARRGNGPTAPPMPPELLPGARWLVS